VDLAARQVTGSFLKSLEGCIGEMKKNIAHQEAFISAGIRFHRLIAEMAQNEILILIWDMLANLIRKSQSKIYGIPWSPRRALHAHRKIYLALKEKDPPRAVEAMRQHMLDEEKALVTALKKRKG
jgi:DNA-binding FadR family transcriptional regulator